MVRLNLQARRTQPILTIQIRHWVLCDCSATCSMRVSKCSESRASLPKKRTLGKEAWMTAQSHSQETNQGKDQPCVNHATSQASACSILGLVDAVKIARGTGNSSSKLLALLQTHIFSTKKGMMGI